MVNKSRNRKKRDYEKYKHREGRKVKKKRKAVKFYIILLYYIFVNIFL